MENLSYILLIAFNIVIALMIARYGAQRKIGWLITFLVSFFGTPLLGIICVMLSDKISPETKEFDLDRFRKA